MPNTARRVIGLLLATIVAAGCSLPIRQAAEAAFGPDATSAPTEVAADDSTAEATPEPTEQPRPNGGKDLPVQPQLELDEDLCAEIGGDWNTVSNKCEHPSLIAPQPDATEAFLRIGLILNDEDSELGVTEAEFVQRWNDHVALHGIAAEAALDDLRGFDHGSLYFVRDDILTVSLQVYLHDDDGELATVGVGAFPDLFVTWSTWRVAEAAMLGASPELDDVEATSILTTLVAGYDTDVTGIDSTVSWEGRRYRLIDGGRDNGVWLTITSYSGENEPPVLATPGP